MKRTIIVAGVAALVAAGAADAQIIDGGRDGRSRIGAPKAWTSLFVGWTQHQALCDPDSDSCWDFGSAMQWRGTLEVPVGNGVTVGAVGTHARMPLRYSSGLLVGSVDADANVSQVLGQLRVGGGAGIHQVIDITAGMSLFSNFRRTSDGQRIGPTGTTRNWSFALGYGFALPLSPRAQVILLQEYGIVVGKRLQGQSSNTAQSQTLRLGMRLGLGR